MAEAALRMVAQERKAVCDGGESEDPWERELGMDEVPYNPPGEDDPK